MHWCRKLRSIMNVKLQTKKLRLVRLKQIIQGHKGDVGHVESKADSSLL